MCGCTHSDMSPAYFLGSFTMFAHFQLVVFFGAVRLFAVFDAFFVVFDALSLFSSLFFGQFRWLPPLLSSCFDVLLHRQM